MKNLDLIKEELFNVGDSPELRSLIMDSPGSFEGESEVDLIERYPYGFVSYIEQNQRRLIYFVLSSNQEQEDQRQTLIDLIAEQNPVSFLDLVFILTLYDPLGHRESTVRRPQNGLCLILGDDLFDSLFLESRGYLVYNHQFEMMYQMVTGCNPSQATRFRKSFWRKEAWAWMETELLRFPNGKTMRNIMDERMVDEVTNVPNYCGAMNLYECCFI